MSIRVTEVAKEATENVGVETPHISVERLILLQDTVIMLAKLAEDGQISGYKKIDMAMMHLPATPLSATPTRVSDRPDVMSVIHAAARSYAQRITPGKSFALVASRMIRVAVKTIEFGWLHGRYNLGDWTPSLVHKLTAELAQSGWAGALQIRQRTKAFADSISPKEASSFLYTHDERRGLALRRQFNEQVGTCACQVELYVAKQELALRAGTVLEANIFELQERKRARSSESGMSIKHLQQQLWCLNILSDIPDGMGFGFSPVPEPETRARTLGRKNDRTENLGPGHVAAILVEAQRWQRELAEPLLGIWADIEVALAEKKPATSVALRYVLNSVVSRSQKRRTLERALNVEIKGAASLEYHQGVASLALLTNALVTSSFVTIAIFNARRKDEVQHPEFGLRRGALSVIDEKLSLFECSFYIEKTHRIRMPFYVNAYTRRAVELLERTSDMARRLLQARAGASLPLPDGLFLIPRPGVMQDEPGLRWYSFGTSLLGQARWFFALALGDQELRLKAHMFRRAYALLFHYRYENSSLISLAQQFGHLDLDVIHVYVTDIHKGGAAAGAEMYAKVAPHLRQAYEDSSKGVLQEVHSVAVERVEMFVREVVDGAVSFSGGFTRLVQRLHQHLGLRVEYQGLTNKEKSETVARLLTGRGHEFRPFPHGNCVAPDGRPAPLAHCSSSDSRLPRRENASSIACGRCPYHVVSEAHVKALENELAHMKSNRHEASAETSLAALRADADIENLQRLISLHRKNLQLQEL
nr:hypothetical protein [uncultured Comamonas sp.]